MAGNDSGKLAFDTSKKNIRMVYISNDLACNR